MKRTVISTVSGRSVGVASSAFSRLAVFAAVLVLGATLLAPTASFAGDGMDPEAYRTRDVGSGRVTIDVEDQPFGQVIRELVSPATSMNIVVSPEAEAEPVTLNVQDLHWVHALTALTKKVGGVILEEADNLLKIERPEPVTFSYTDTDINEVIGSFGDYSGANIIVSPKVNGKVTVTLKNVPWRNALEEIVRTVGPFAVVEEKFGMLRVVPRNELELTQGYHRFRFIRPPAPYRGVIAGTSGGGGGGSGGSGGSGGGQSTSDIILGSPTVPSDNPADIEANFPIIGALKQIVAPEGGTVSYISSQNAIIFTGTKPRIRELRDMLKQLDVEPPQVFIEMNFVVTSNSDALNLGLDAGDTSGLSLGLSGSDIIHALPFNTGDGDGIAKALTGAAFPAPASSAFSHGTLTTSETQLLWKFLQRDSRSRIVQAPKLLALDNQESTIFIGEQIRYARTTAATNQNGGLTFSVEEDPNSPVSVGFQLLVIPHIIPGENKIRMLVIPQRRALTGTGPLAGFDRITVSGQSIDLPRVQSSSLVTHMIVRDRETAIIGGLMEEREVERADKWPFFGDLPIIGAAFQGKEKSRIREHLLITITPRIVRGTDAVNTRISDELANRSNGLSAEYQSLYGDCAGGTSSYGNVTPTYGTYSVPQGGVVVPEGTVLPNGSVYSSDLPAGAEAPAGAVEGAADAANSAGSMTAPEEAPPAGDSIPVAPGR